MDHKIFAGNQQIPVKPSYVQVAGLKIRIIFKPQTKLASTGIERIRNTQGIERLINFITNDSSDKLERSHLACMTDGPGSEQEDHCQARGNKKKERFSTLRHYNHRSRGKQVEYNDLSLKSKIGSREFILAISILISQG